LDQRLVIRAQTGDGEAFAALASDAFDWLRRTAWLILRDAGAVDDVVQETLLGAWLDLPRLREPDRFQAWLRRLLVRACADHARRRSLARVREVDLVVGEAPTSADIQHRTAERDQLERGLRALTVDQRTVLVLTYYVDLPVAEAARVLDIPVGTMKSRLDRARTALRAALDADERGVALTQEQFA
jgi:RNA polymerase sigma-70 factor (ECF subfamily)